MLDFKELERFSRDMKRGFRPHVSEKVNRSEVDLLMLVSRDPNQSFRRYGKHIHLEKSSFSYIVDLLVLKGLVVKIEDEEDKRRKTLEITEKGEALVKELGQQRDAYIEKRLSIFTKEEIDELENVVKVTEKYGEKLRKAFPYEDERPHRRKRQPDLEYRSHHRHHPGK
jgi:DNA-binding MarR family transcriptional regulator